MSGATLDSLIVKGTSISEDELKTLLQLPDNHGEAIEHVFKNRMYSTTEDALADLSKAIGSEFIKDIPFNDIPVDLVRDIPINYAKNQEVLPFKMENDKVIVLTTNPLNNRALTDMRVLFNKRIQPLLTTSVKLQDAINRVYEKSTAALEGLDDIDSEEYDLDDPVIDLLEAGD